MSPAIGRETEHQRPSGESENSSRGVIGPHSTPIVLTAEVTSNNVVAPEDISMQSPVAVVESQQPQESHLATNAPASAPPTVTGNSVSTRDEDAMHFADALANRDKNQAATALFVAEGVVETIQIRASAVSAAVVSAYSSARDVNGWSVTTAEGERQGAVLRVDQALQFIQLDVRCLAKHARLALLKQCDAAIRGNAPSPETARGPLPGYERRRTAPRPATSVAQGNIYHSILTLLRDTVQDVAGSIVSNFSTIYRHNGKPATQLDEVTQVALRELDSLFEMVQDAFHAFSRCARRAVQRQFEQALVGNALGIVSAREGLDRYAPPSGSDLLDEEEMDGHIGEA
ncbi:unnamed protein product [Peniophora sp. CBMAI 1063]|nr:unnamed protein product [Peniophora sp. CBMAI 1063]